MPLRVHEGIDVPLERSPSRELLSGLHLDEVPLLPFEAGEPGPGEPNGRVGVRTVNQKPMDEWCWAACAEMVLRFFGVVVDKCSVAEFILGRKSCCPTSAACDEGRSVKQIDDALACIGLVGNRFADLKFEQVRAQIEGGPALGTPGLSLPRRPVVAGIRWQDGGGHLVVISGWRVTNSLRYLKVNDPYYQSGDIRYEDFLDKYGPNNNGRWVHTWADLRRAG